MQYHIIHFVQGTRVLSSLTRNYEVFSPLYFEKSICKRTFYDRQIKVNVCQPLVPAEHNKHIVFICS